MAKCKIKNFIAIIICGLLLISFPAQSFALDKNTDTDILADNISYIANYVEKNGYINAGGYPVINHNSQGASGGIINEKNQLHLMYVWEDSDTLVNSYVDMYVKYPYEETYYVDVGVYFHDSNGNITNGVESNAMVDPSDYDFQNDSIRFIISKTTASAAYAQNWSNTAFDNAISFWNELIGNKIDVGISELGFSKNCSHDWSGEVAVPPTKTAEGEAKYTCNWCGLVEYESIPADVWSAKGKTVSIKASTVKKKAVSVASKKCFTLKNCEYRDLSYKKLKGNSKITINSKTGKITVKKGLKKGTYKVVVNVKSKASDLYGASSKKVTITVKVK